MPAMAEAFETELERVVARVAHELAREITALILRRLGVDSASAPAGAARALRGPAPSRGVSARRNGAGRPPKEPTRRRGRATSEERAVMLAEIERAVSGAGMSLGEIERATKMSRSALTSALKTLKEEGRVFMGGNRRFARYATTQAAADRASLDARRGAAA